MQDYFYYQADVKHKLSQRVNVPKCCILYIWLNVIKFN